MRTLYLCVRAFGMLFDGLDYNWLWPEFEANAELELDFEQEGRNAERVAAMFSNDPFVYIPAVCWPLTTRCIITQEFIGGLACRPDDKEGLNKLCISSLSVASAISRVFAEMMLVHGFVHCDPHLGNILVRSRPSFNENGNDKNNNTITNWCFNLISSTFAPIFLNCFSFSSYLHSNNSKYDSENFQVVILDHGTCNVT